MTFHTETSSNYFVEAKAFLEGGVGERERKMGVWYMTNVFILSASCILASNFFSSIYCIDVLEAGMGSQEN